MKEGTKKTMKELIVKKTRLLIKPTLTATT